jgi:hypothetical protein
MDFIRKPLWVLFAVLALGYQQTQAMEQEERENYFLHIPAEMKHSILKETLMLDRLQNKSFEDACKNLSGVCKYWHTIIKKNAQRWVCEYFNIKKEDKDVFWRFFKGKLIFKPDPNSDKEMVKLFISSLPNPLEGTFNLPKYSEYLSINTGYRKGKKEENAEKSEIWIAPRFLIERDLETTAMHFKPIMDNWNQEQAPVGMFWNWGGEVVLKYFDYRTAESMENLSKISLYRNWQKSTAQVWLGLVCNIDNEGVGHFMFSL